MVSDRLPDIGEVLAPLLAAVPREQQPLLIALAERMAAERYRGWAADPAVRDRAADLRACADREEEIARRVEALYPDAAALQVEMRRRHPELDEVNRRVIDDLALLSDDSYGKGWLLKLRISDAQGLDELLDERAYSAHCANESRH